MKTSLALLVSLVLLTGVTGCAGDDGALAPLAVPEGCNPLAADGDCLLPFPSDHFRVDDPKNPGKKAVTFSPSATPRTKSNNPIELLAAHPVDGYSPGTQILALFPRGVDPSNLVGAGSDLNQSVTAASPTVLLNAETGERVPHLAELDPRADTDDRRALVLRPLIRLSPGKRYIVGIHDLKDLGGGAAAAPEGFRRIRDNEAASSPALTGEAAHFEADVFPALLKAGVARNSLQLAWDFTIASEETLTRDMLAIRADLLPRLAASPPAITVTKVTDDVNAHIKRRIDASMKVPLYLESADVSAKLHYDAKGGVTPNGEVDVPFTVWIPTSVANRAPGDPPARLLQYGHGFFGTREEAAGAFVNEFADEKGFVVVAADWWGMSEPDRFAVADAIAIDAGNTMQFTDRVHQAMANFIALGEVASGPLASLPEAAVGPQPTFDPKQLYFYGISQGGILGGTYLALTPRVERGVLGVNGADLSMMMFRAQPFISFLFILGTVISDPLDMQKLCALTQSTFDRVDPLTYAPHVLTDTFPGSPKERRVLSQIGVADAAVPNLGSHIEARALGLPRLTPATARAIPFLAEAASPVDGSALVEFDFGVDPATVQEATPSTQENDVHEAVRRLAADKAQIDAFLRPSGLISNTCSDACDPD